MTDILETASDKKHSQQFSYGQSFAYALPAGGVFFLFGPLAVLQGIYAKYFGLTLTSIAAVILVSRIFDAVTDPFIGYFSDRYFFHYGSRKPFVVAGGLLFVVSSWFLYVPQGEVSTAYFLVWSLAFYFAYTLFEIPHLAWGGELAETSIDKSRIYGVRTLAVFTGSLLFFSIPLLPFFATSDITPSTLRWSVALVGIAMLPLLYACVRHVPSPKRPFSHSDKEIHPSTLKNLQQLYQSISANKPFIVLTLAHICTGFGSGMWFALLFLYVDAYLGLGGAFALTYLISYGLSIPTLRFWYQLSARKGKQFTWAVGMLLSALGVFGTGLLSPASTSWLSLLICMALIYSGFAAFGIMVPSLLSDIVDFATWKFGAARGATYFSIYTFINKFVSAVGGALALAIAGWSGFDPTATIHSSDTIVGLGFAIAWMPSLLIVASIFLITRISITARRHSLIRRRLDGRIARSQKIATQQLPDSKLVSRSDTKSCLYSVR